MKKLRHHYSGKKSKRFWKIVNDEMRTTESETAYALGCCLQNLEGFVLRYISNNTDKKFVADE